MHGGICLHSPPNQERINSYSSPCKSNRHPEGTQKSHVGLVIPLALGCFVYCHYASPMQGFDW